MLCENCQQRPATQHLCEPHLQRNRHLCEACADAGFPQMREWNRRYQEALKTGKCQYCGEPAVAGGGGLNPLSGENWQFWCETCRQDLAEYAKAHETTSHPEPEMTEAGMDRYLAWAAEEQCKLHAYMREKVAARKGKR